MCVVLMVLEVVLELLEVVMELLEHILTSRSPTQGFDPTNIVLD